jgi:hypothetical protein
MMRILDIRRRGENDCVITLGLGEITYELVACGIGRHELSGGVVSSFEPWSVFRKLPLSAAQVRTLTRTAVEFHEGASLVFPIDVPV